MNETISASRAGTIAIGGDLRVARMGFGAMRLCGQGVWGWPKDRESALAVLRRAVDLGVNFIDTADAYGPGVNEEQIAQALHPYPSDLVIATKGGSTRSGPGQWSRDCRPERLKQTCEESLRRLKLETIDLYQLHAVDAKLPYVEQIGALYELQSAGKIRHIGVSNVTVEQLRAARSVATIASVQNRYNLSELESQPVLDICERGGLVFIPWFPLNAGDIDQNLNLKKIAHDKNLTPWQIALAWLIFRSPAILPIPGTSSIAHLEENVAAVGVDLTAAQLEKLA
ncbi:MAG: aldo/keto reductase [Candidatus Eremiobacteraeota bacterium]|nr:aldo/keto reductase [Candidatus Eremiobacteraeota bacterium]